MIAKSPRLCVLNIVINRVHVVHSNRVDFGSVGKKNKEWGIASWINVYSYLGREYAMQEKIIESSNSLFIYIFK